MSKENKPVIFSLLVISMENTKMMKDFKDMEQNEIMSVFKEERVLYGCTAMVSAASLSYVAEGHLLFGPITKSSVSVSSSCLDLFLSFFIMDLNILYSTWFQSIRKPGGSILICLLKGLLFNSILVFLLPMAFGVIAELLTLISCLILLKCTNKSRKYE